MIVLSRGTADKGRTSLLGTHYFKCNGTILACYDPVKEGDKQEKWNFHSNQYIYFAVEDLETTYSLVRVSGGELEGDIQIMPWGERIFYCKDPFGNPVSFVDQNTIFIGEN
ncbi:VOC family protein [Paenibacillus alkalitolerans]|uniref:VOC family protein n=1 Tax=Paenibacillus alkalitolerans TaxID=2799335 RepID=UPI0018F3181C